jgi:hypothetical protein
MSPAEELALAEASVLVDSIEELEDRLLVLRGFVRDAHGTYRDGSGGGAPYSRGRALEVATRDVRAAIWNAAVNP